VERSITGKMEATPAANKPTITMLSRRKCETPPAANARENGSAASQSDEEGEPRDWSLQHIGKQLRTNIPRLDGDDDEASADHHPQDSR
jgi:hypothetical protein